MGVCKKLLYLHAMTTKSLIIIYRSLLPTLLFMYLAFCPGAWEAYAADSEVGAEKVQACLVRLDYLLEHRNDMLDVRMKRIDALRARMHNKTDARVMYNMAEAFEGINNDSTMHYLYRAIELSPDSLTRHLSSMYLASIMPLGGLFKEAKDLYARVDTARFDKSQMIEYYRYGRDLYYNISQFYESRPEVFRRWEAVVAEYQHKYLNSLLHGAEDNRFRLAFGEDLLRSGRFAEAQTVLRDVLHAESADTHIRSRSAYLLSLISKRRKDMDGYIYYLSHAVSADIQRGDVDLPSLHNLGLALYKAGDDSRAYRYLSIAEQDASKTAIMLRKVQASTAAPFVQSDHVAKIERSRLYLIVTVIALVAAIGVVGFMLVRARRETHKLHSMRQDLSMANQVREMYIAQFLSLCSVYMDRLHEFSEYVKNKIKSGKIDEVARLVQSGRFLDQQSQAFFQVFDEAFLHLYPDFVNQVNELLLPDKRIELKDGEQLNTDLRILAFMRMGIEDSGHIAHILNYAVNTIYAYRNKLRNRAINRDTFEEDLMRIQGQ